MSDDVRPGVSKLVWTQGDQKSMPLSFCFRCGGQFPHGRAGEAIFTNGWLRVSAHREQIMLHLDCARELADRLREELDA